MVAEPSAAGGPDAVNVVDGGSAAPEVGVMMRHPTATSVLFTGSASATDCQIVYHGKQRLGAFAQIAQLSGPIVHFTINVQRPLGFPRRIQLFVPKALQISWLTARPAAGDEQVTAILKIQGSKGGVAIQSRLFDGLQAFVRGQI